MEAYPKSRRFGFGSYEDYPSFICHNDSDRIFCFCFCFFTFLRVLTENRYKLFLVPVGGLSSRKGAGQYEELTNQIQFDHRVQALRVLFCFGLFSLFRSLGGRQWARRCAVYERVCACARAQKYSSPVYLPLSP